MLCKLCFPYFFLIIWTNVWLKWNIFFASGEKKNIVPQGVVEMMNALMNREEERGVQWGVVMRGWGGLRIWIDCKPLLNSWAWILQIMNLKLKSGHYKLILQKNQRKLLARRGLKISESRQKSISKYGSSWVCTWQTTSYLKAILFAHKYARNVE